MPGSFQRTRFSAETRTVLNARVIDFLTPPRYRNLLVNIGDNKKLELHDIVILQGNNQGGTRAVVDNFTQVKSGRCKVLIDNCRYIIHESFSGPVSSGVEEY